MSKFLLDSIAPEYRRSSDWDNPRPTEERRITIGAKPAITDYELIREALEDLLKDLRIETRDAQERLVITYLIPKAAEASYSKALKILSKTPPTRNSTVTKL